MLILLMLLLQLSGDQIPVMAQMRGDSHNNWTVIVRGPYMPAETSSAVIEVVAIPGKPFLRGDGWAITPDVTDILIRKTKEPTTTPLSVVEVPYNWVLSGGKRVESMGAVAHFQPQELPDGSQIVLVTSAGEKVFTLQRKR
jgi:hypothetical protein